MKRLVKLLLVCLVSLMLSGIALSRVHNWDTFALKVKLPQNFSWYSAVEVRSYYGLYYQHWHNALDRKLDNHWTFGIAYRYCDFVEKGLIEHRPMLNLTWKSNKIGNGLYVKNRFRLTRRVCTSDDLWRIRNKVTISFAVAFVAWEGFMEESQNSLYRERHYIGLNVGPAQVFFMSERKIDKYKPVLGVTFTVKI